MKLTKSIIATILLVALAISMSFGAVAFAAETETRYADFSSGASTYATTTSETVNYTRREESYIEVAYGVPRYTQRSAYPNSCGATAGAIVVGFYDKYYEDLIPNYKTYVSTGKYKGNDYTYIPQLMGELYTLMRTNVDDVGVSETDCKNGLKAYVNNKGLSLTYNSVKGFNKINETTYQNAINNNKPVLLFCSKMDMYAVSISSNYDTVVKTTMEGAHVAVGYGMYIVKYYNGNTLFRTDKYLRVATGFAGLQDSYLKLDATDWCNAAYSVTIS